MHKRITRILLFLLLLLLLIPFLVLLSTTTVLALKSTDIDRSGQVNGLDVIMLISYL